MLRKERGIRCFLVFAFFAISCVSAEKYQGYDIAGYTTIFEIPVGEKVVKIMNYKDIKPRHSDKLKMSLVNSKGTILDVKDFGYLDIDGSIVSKNTIAIKGKRTNENEPVNFFLVVEESSDLIKQIPCNNFVADGIITDGYIIYSIEMTLDTTIKIDIKDGKVFEYEGYYPCVDIFECEKSGILGIFKYEDKWYEILDKKIKPAKEPYQPKQKRKLNDYLVK